MRHHASLRLGLLALLLLLAPHALAGSQGSDSTAALSSLPATRATAVSDPNPPLPPGADLGEGRVIFAPVGEGPGDQFGNSVASAGDVNGDGYPDVIVGAWSSDANIGDAGSAYVYFGGPGADAVPDWILRGHALGENFGTSVASAGDVNGDGFGDVIVGAWLGVSGNMRPGRAYVYFGGPSPDDVADLVLVGEANNDHFGVSVSSAGDLNGDGFSDVIVGAPENDAGGSDAGRAYVYFGGAVPNNVADMRMAGTGGGDRSDHFGYKVASGDFNGDGFSDVVVGAYQTGAQGYASVFFGGPGFDAVADRVLTGQATGDRFGISLANAGDVNGDGYTDLIVGADKNDAGGVDAGRAYVYYEGPGADGIADLLLTGALGGDNFGQSAASAGDMNGDGFGDVIVGTGLTDVKGTDAGRAYVYFGGPAADGVADLTLTGEATDDRLGSSVAGVGDFDRDGGGDVVVGAYFADVVDQDVGRAYFVTLAGHPPAVTAPVLVNGTTGSPIEFSVTASDADGDAIASLAAAPLPAGASFTPSAGNTSGAFSWTPGAGQTGDYNVTFTAANDRTGYAITRIHVVPAPNQLPTLDQIADMSVNEGATADQVLHGSDPDGDPLTFGLAGGPAFVSVTTIDAVSGSLHVAPGFGVASSYPATVRANDGHGGDATRSLQIVVNHVNRPPVLTVPAGIFGAEGVAISITITAVDPDGDLVTLGAINRPVGSLFIDQGNSSGSFSWTPGFGQAGTYTVTFTARDALGAQAAPRNLTITVDDVNRPPVAGPGGPYAGVIQVPITFNGTGSSDPDGTPLRYLWDFGDLTTATGVTPSHSYSTGGTFTVTLTVDDGGLTDDASTIATIQDVFPARAFALSSNRTIRLGSGKATWCAEIEPTGGAFLITDVLPSTVTMKYGTGQIFAQTGQVSLGADKDANGIQEVTTCFSKADLRTLFSGLHKGTSTVTVTLEGNLSTGGTFRTTLTLDVVSSGGNLAASLSPNPLNPTATLTVLTSRPGRVRVTVFDTQGRLVRSLEPGAFLGAGYHDFHVDGRGERGELLPSGAYLYRIETAEGVETGRFVIVR